MGQDSTAYGIAGYEGQGEPHEYVCCLGYCWPMNRCSCPETPCLCIESCCCTWQAVMANRYAIQDRWTIENDCCDECLICMVVCVSWCRCIMELFGADVPEEVENIIDLLAASVMVCMLSQQQAELDNRDPGNFAYPNQAEAAADYQYNTQSADYGVGNWEGRGGGGARKEYVD